MRPHLLFSLFLVGIASPVEAMDLNSFRAQQGRSPLRVDPTLSGLAYHHALDMARRNSLDHRGFATERGPHGASAENVSYGCADEPCAILQWARSPRHRANMLRRDVTTYGLASAVSASGRRYWAMELGGAPPVMIAPRGRKPRLEAASGRASHSRSGD